MKNQLEIKSLHVSIEGKEILSGVSLSIPEGEVHAIMGPNGSGKSTLANAIMGDPRYEITGGEVLFKGENILDRSTDERARMGLFLGFQYPVSLPGIPLNRLIRKSSSLIGKKEIYPTMEKFKEAISEAGKLLGMSQEMMDRPANEGFSGGEKKKAEILQMQMLKPDLVILDEVDSGLDIDALNDVAHAVNSIRSNKRSFLIITHYRRVLSLIRPDVVHIMKNGAVIRSGSAKLVEELEKEGYANVEAA